MKERIAIIACGLLAAGGDKDEDTGADTAEVADTAGDDDSESE